MQVISACRYISHRRRHLSRHAEDGEQDRRLARTGAPAQSEPLAVGYGERDTAEHLAQAQSQKNDDETEGDEYCEHGYDPEKINIPLSQVYVAKSGSGENAGLKTSLNDNIELILMIGDYTHQNIIV